LRYVEFIKDEKVKILILQWTSPSFYRDRIQFDEPMTLEEAIRKDKYLYENKKGISMVLNYWKDNKNDKLDQRKKIFKSPFLRKKFNSYHHCYTYLSESDLDFMGRRQ
jgi:hypothetical protein